VRGLARRLVGDQKLHHHFLRGDGAVTEVFTFMPTSRALAGRRQNALASISTMQARQLPSGR
jgi:hypothetical protein